MKTETLNQKSIVFIRRKEERSSLEARGYYELYNKSFQLIGKITEDSDQGSLTEVKSVKGYLNEEHDAAAYCNFEPSLKSKMIQLKRNELLECNRIFPDNANGFSCSFNLADLGKNPVKTDEEREAELKIIRECGYLVKGLISLILTFLFASYGGWWWIPTIAAACYSLNSFRET